MNNMPLFNVLISSIHFLGDVSSWSKSYFEMKKWNKKKKNEKILFVLFLLIGSVLEYMRNDKC